MKRILICPNPMRDIDLSTANVIMSALNGHAIATVYPLDYVSEARTEPIGADLEAICKEIEQSDVVVCLGGDGTILHLARMTAPLGVPLLTVNLGTKGFMAELEADEIDQIIAAALAEKIRIDERMMIDVQVSRAGKIIFSDFALNDAVVRGLTRIVNLSVYGDNQLITHFSGDGIIISTPTGSTAYSMSAGGPIVEPSAKNLAIVPICAHALIAKSFVLAPERKVMVKLALFGGKEAFLSVDGGSFPLENEDEIYLQQSSYVTRLVRVSGRSFYQLLGEKLGSSGEKL